MANISEGDTSETLSPEKAANKGHNLRKSTSSHEKSQLNKISASLLLHNEEEDVKNSDVRMSKVIKIPTDINNSIHNTLSEKIIHWKEGMCNI